MFVDSGEATTALATIQMSDAGKMNHYFNFISWPNTRKLRQV